MAAYLEQYYELKTDLTDTQVGQLFMTGLKHGSLGNGDPTLASKTFTYI